MNFMRLDTAATAVDADEFISSLQPSLSQGNMEETLRYVQQRWTAPQIIALLRDSSADVRKMAALALSMVGDQRAIGALAVALHDNDEIVSQIAEHGLWSVWFRASTPRAVELVKCGNHHLHHGNYASAVERFTQALQEDPGFAEAYNQRAITYYLTERFDESIADCKAALVHVPQHFGAMAGMGHCYTHLGDWRQARQCYRLALAIHPRMEGIQGALDQIDQLLREERSA
jgi:tetratricopeptide (TPR) repeat protein